MAKDAMESYFDYLDEQPTYMDALDGGLMSGLDQDGPSSIESQELVPSIYQDVFAEKEETTTPQESTMLGNLGTAVWGALDEAAFGIPELVATKGLGIEFEKWEDQTGSEKASETVGRFAGFLVGAPMKVGRKALQYVGGKAINKVLKEETAEQLVKGTTDKIVKSIGAKAGASEAIEQVAKEAGQSYLQINQRAKWTTSVSKNFKSKSVNNMENMIKKNVGLGKITQAEGNALKQVFETNFSKQSASDFVSLMQKYYPGRKGAILGEMINEAVIWGTIDAAMELPRSISEDRPYDWMTPIYGTAFGSVLGPLSFWRLGGKNASFKKTFGDGVRGLFNKNIYKDLDVDQLRKLSRWHASTITTDAAGNKIANKISTRRAVELEGKTYNVDLAKPGTTLSVKNGEEVSEILQKKVLKKALDTERKKHGAGLVSMAFKEEWSNLTSVWPRMFAGAAIMAGPQALQVAAGEKFDWEVSMVHIMMGAYMMRKGASGTDWDIQAARMGQLRRGMRSLGIDATSDTFALSPFRGGDNESIDPYKTSDQLSDLKSQAEQLGIITSDADATELLIKRSAKTEMLENPGSLDVFESMWSSLNGQTGPGKYLVPLESIPAEVALNMQKRIKNGTWDDLGGAKINNSNDFLTIYNKSIMTSVDTFESHVLKTVRSIFGTEDGLGYDLNSGNHLGKLPENVSMTSELEAEAAKGAKGKFADMFKGDDAGLTGDDAINRVNIILDKTNALSNIVKSIDKADSNSNPGTKFKTLGKDETVDEAIDKIFTIKGFIEGSEAYLTKQLGGAVDIDFNNPNLDIVGWMRLNAARRGEENIGLAFNRDEQSHEALKNALLNSGVLINKADRAEAFLPEKLDNINEIIDFPDHLPEEDRMLAVQMIRAAHKLLAVQKQYKPTEDQPQSIRYSDIMGPNKGSLWSELNSRNISPNLFVQSAERIASNIMAKQITQTELRTNDMTFLSTFISQEGLDLVRYNPISGEKFAGFIAKEIRTTSNEADDLAIVDKYNRTIRDISERSTAKDRTRLVAVSEEEIPIINPNQLKRIEELMIEENHFFDLQDGARTFLTKFFDAVEGNEPFRYAAKAFMDQAPGNSGKLAAMLHSTGIVKIDPRLGEETYNIDSEDFAKNFTDEAKEKIIRYMKGYGTSIDVVEANMQDAVAKYHADSESLFSSSIGKKGMSQTDYFKKYHENSASDVTEQNKMIHDALSKDDKSNALLDMIRNVTRVDGNEVTYNVKTRLPEMSNAQYKQLAMDTAGLLAGRLGSDTMATLKLSNGTLRYDKQTVQKNFITDYISTEFAGTGLNTFLVDPNVKLRTDGVLRTVDVTTVGNKDISEDKGGIRTLAYKALKKQLKNTENIKIIDKKGEDGTLLEQDTLDDAGVKRGIETVTLGWGIPMLGVLRKDYYKVEAEFITTFKEFQKGGTHEGLFDSAGKAKLKGIMDEFSINPQTGVAINDQWGAFHTQAMRDLVYLKMLGVEEFALRWNEGKGGDLLDKTIKRFSLAFTPSAKRLSSDLLTMTRNALLESPNTSSSMDNVKALNHYINRGKYGVAVYNDKSASNKSVSIKERYTKTIEELYGPGKGPKWDDIQSGRSDESGFDSIAFASTRLIRALSSSYGMSADGIHSVWKPIISSNKEGAILYGKTVIIHDPYLDKQVFSKNDNLDIMLMDSGAKIGGGERVDLTISELTRDSNQSGFLNNNVVDYDFNSLGIIQAPKNEAAGKLSQQLHSYMDDVSWEPIYQAYYEGNIIEANKLMDNYTNDPNMMREFMLNRNGMDDDFLLAEMASSGGAGEHLGAMAMYLNSTPFANPRAFGDNVIMNAMKRKIVDKMLNPDTVINGTKYGGKAVLMQTMNPKFRDMKQTIVQEDGTLVQYGEVALPAYERDTPLSKIITKGRQEHDFSIKFIKRNEGTEADQVMSLEDMVKYIESVGYKEGSRMHGRLNNLLTGDYKGEIATLGNLADLLKERFPKMKDKVTDVFQLAIATTRYPRTRANDLALLGLKDFVDADYGNSMIINDHDVLTLFEGDYDVDKADYYFQGTNDFWGHVESMKDMWTHGVDPSKQTPYTHNIEFGSSNASINNESWTQHIGSEKAYSKAIGKVQKLAKSLGHLAAATYKSDVKRDGVTTQDSVIGEYNVYNNDGTISEKRRVIMNHDDKNERHRRAFESQAMIDAKANRSLFTKLEKWRDEYLFPDRDKSISPNDDSVDANLKKAIADGTIPEKRLRLFEEVSLSSDGKTWTPVDESLSITAKEGIMNLIDQHSKLLTLGTEVYDGTGVGRKPSYQDMIGISGDYFLHAQDINKSLYKRNRRNIGFGKRGIKNAEKMFREKTKKYKDWSDKKTPGKEKFYSYMDSSADGFYHPDVVNYFQKLANGEKGSPFERSMHYLQENDPLRQNAVELFEGERYLEVDRMFEDFIDNKYDANNLMTNMAALMKNKNDAIKGIKYLKSQFYKAKTRKQIEGLNRAIAKHESILTKLVGPDALKEYLTTGQSKWLPDKLNLVSIDSNQDMIDGTVQMYTLSPVTSLFTGKSEKFQTDLSDMRTFDARFWGDELGNLSNSLQYGKTTLLTPPEVAKYGTRPQPEQIDEIAMARLDEKVQEHGIVFLWHYAKPAEGRGVGVFNNKAIPYAAKSAKNRYTRMNKYLATKAREGSAYHQKVMEIVAKRHGVYSNLFSKNTHLVPNGGNELLSEQIRMPKFGNELISQLDNFTKLSFGRNKNDSSALSGGLHYDHVVSLFKDMYKMAGREQDFNTFTKQLSKLHEMMQSQNMVDPTTYFLTMEKMKGDMYDFVRNNFAVKGDDGRVKTLNRNLEKNELYLLMGGNDFQGKGVTLNPVDALNPYMKIQNQLLAGQADQLSKRTYSTTEEEYLYGGCGGRAS
tara:strand:+ start:6058 stop:14679 length:8622 start_codon:yes stop_codon:yes gene_type:complete